MRVIFVGPPGSGKGTQSKLVCRRNNLAYLGTGDILREATQAGTPTGLRAKPFMDVGQLVPDDLVNALVAERLGRDDCPEKFVIDGYPRTVAQARALDVVLDSRKLSLTAVLVMRVPDDEVIRRLTVGGGRGRGDDAIETIRSRLEMFHRDTAAIAAHYRPKGVLHEVSGLGEIEQIYNIIMKILSPS